MAKINQKPYSKIHYSLSLILGGILLLAAVSCQAAATRQPETQTEEPENTQVVDSVPSQEEGEGTSGEDQGQVVEVEDPNQCLICHTDKQTLMDTADPVVVVESESSGEG
jgi:hypothetical protein